MWSQVLALYTPSGVSRNILKLLPKPPSVHLSMSKYYEKFIDYGFIS